MNVTAIIAGLLMLMGVNQYRAEHQLAPLSWSVDTCIIAMIRVEDIQTECSHRLFSQRTNLVNIGGWFYEDLGRYYGENQWQGMLEEWKKSPSHNEILLSPATEGCVAYSNGHWALTFHQSQYE